MRGPLERILEHGRQRPAAGFFAAIDKPAPEGLDSAHAYLLGIPHPVIVTCSNNTRSGWVRRSGTVGRWPVSRRTPTVGPLR